MAYRFFGSSATDVFEKVTITEQYPDCASITFTPFQDIIHAARLDPAETENLRSNGIELLFIDSTKNFLSINPVSTFVSQDGFLRPKYREIRSITLDGFFFETPKDEDELQDMLEKLPTGFIKDYQYGLGLLKELDPIIHTVSRIPDVKHLVISNREGTKIDKDIYYLAYEEFENLRLVLNRVISHHQRDSRQERYRIAHNTLLTATSPEIYPPKRKPYKNNAVSEMVSNTEIHDNALSKIDTEAIVGLTRSNKKLIYKRFKNEVDELQLDFNLLNLESVMDESQRLFESKRSTESRWQNLLNDNPIVLPLLFGHSVVKIQDQASVGGRTISGNGDKVTDFLVKNSLTNNLAIIEIKKPSTPLLRPSSYRENVYAATRDLAGSIAQSLDQKYRLQKEIASIKDNSGIYDMESYAIECILVIGTLPVGKDQIKSFELFRNNLKDVKIITFDELIQKMKDIYSILQSDMKKSSSDQI